MEDIYTFSHDQFVITLTHENMIDNKFKGQLIISELLESPRSYLGLDLNVAPENFPTINLHMYDIQGTISENELHIIFLNDPIKGKFFKLPNYLNEKIWKGTKESDSIKINDIFKFEELILSLRNSTDYHKELTRLTDKLEQLRIKNN